MKPNKSVDELSKEDIIQKRIDQANKRWDKKLEQEKKEILEKSAKEAKEARNKVEKDIKEYLKTNTTKSRKKKTYKNKHNERLDNTIGNAWNKTMDKLHKKALEENKLFDKRKAFKLKGKKITDGLEEGSSIAKAISKYAPKATVGVGAFIGVASIFDLLMSYSDHKESKKQQRIQERNFKRQQKKRVEEYNEQRRLENVTPSYIDTNFLVQQLYNNRNNHSNTWGGRRY